MSPDQGGTSIRSDQASLSVSQRDDPFPSRLTRWRVALLRRTVDLLFTLFTRREVVGLENIPATGPCVLVFNHLSNFDPPLLYTYITRADATGLVAASYRHQPFFRFIVETAGGMWLKRGASDRRALEAALNLLDHGWLVGIAPEGRRSANKALDKAHHGAAWLANRASAPVVPVSVVNTENLAGSLRRLRRATLTVRFGSPFSLPPRGDESRQQHLEICSDMLMCHIATLLPQEYRGIYKEHPMLKRLLED